jgi:hypothetical protein
MTTDCLDKVRFDCTDRKLHDAVYTVVIAFIFVIPATLAALTLV